MPLSFRLSRRQAVALLTASALNSGAYANDLLDSFHLAETQDQTLVIATHQRDSSVEAHPQALAALLPQVSGTLTHARERSHTLNSTQALTNGNTVATDTEPSYFSDDSYQLQLSQAIFDWAAFSRLAETSEAVAQAQATFLNAQQGLIYRVADAYFGVLSAEDTLRADLDAKAAYNRQLTKAQKQFEAGLTTIMDVHSTEASYNSAVAAVIGDMQAVSAARRQLGELVGKSIETIAPLQDEIPLLTPNPASPEHWVSAALSRNPTLLTYAHASRAAEHKITTSRSAYLPTVNLVGSVSRDNQGGEYGNDNIDQTLGVQVNWAILQGGLVRSQVRQAKASHAQAQAQYESYRRSLDRLTRDAYEGVISGIASVEANRLAVRSNQTNLDSTKVGLSVGTRTEVDVLNAQQALTNSQRIYYASRYSYLRSVLSLKQQAGQLTVEDLAAIDAHLLVKPSDEPSTVTSDQPTRVGQAGPVVFVGQLDTTLSKHLNPNKQVISIR